MREKQHIEYPNQILNENHLHQLGYVSCFYSFHRNKSNEKKKKEATWCPSVIHLDKTKVFAPRFRTNFDRQ